VPYRIAALIELHSYVIGHNIGATVFTGGAIRFRIYSDYGLTRSTSQNLFSIRADLLARQSVRAGIGMAWASLGGQRHGPAAAVHQPADRARLPRRHPPPIWPGSSPPRDARQIASTAEGGAAVAALTLVQIGIGVADLGCCRGWRSIC